MYTGMIKDEQKFIDDCTIAFKIYNFVDSLKSDARWFFDSCFCFSNDEYIEIYFVTFKSYITPEYKDYILVINASIDNYNNVNIKVSKKIDNLLH